MKSVPLYRAPAIQRKQLSKDSRMRNLNKSRKRKYRRMLRRTVSSMRPKRRRSKKRMPQSRRGWRRSESPNC